MAGTDRTADMFSPRLDGEPRGRGVYTTSATPLEADLLRAPQEATIISVLAVDPAVPVFVRWEGITAAFDVNVPVSAGSGIINKSGVFEAYTCKPGSYFVVYSAVAGAEYYVAALANGPSGQVQP
jgi:hypothetical protein